MLILLTAKMNTSGLLVLIMCCLLQFCVIDCRPESLNFSAAASTITRQSRSIDQMVFPDSNEDERASLITSMQIRRPLSPTPAPNSDCRQIKVFRHPNGTLGHRYVDCESSTTKQALVPSIGSRFDSKESVTYQNGPVIRPQSSNIDGRDHIIFPDNDSAESRSSPDCANGQRFCTEDSSYPKMKIEQLLQRVGNLNDLLQTDVADDTDIITRVDVPGEETFCDYDSRMEYPTKALSRDEKWLPIVNHSNYTQGIRMEICRNIDRPCKMSEIFPYSIKTKCIQKYQYRQMLALHEDGQLRREYFSMPTCCLCTFSKM